MSKRLFFKVSARTARLIGRENVANAEGAIIELVKNTYDADASICILFFDKNSTLHIIDNGHGMTDEVIETHWMTIGTSNKQSMAISKAGRVRTGEKGIGRFALDRLGEYCELQTKPKQNTKGFIWKVNWQDFEKDNIKTIDDIEASLDTTNSVNYKETVETIIQKLDISEQILRKHRFTNGTAITVKQLRDEWTEHSLEKLYKNLSSLIPPKEEKDFSIFLYSHDFPNRFGEVNADVCNDFDYKVIAKADSNQNVRIRIIRNETDLDSLNKKLFKREGMKEYPFDKETFYKKSFTVSKKFEELVPGFEDDEIFNNIGPFTFTFYFLKKTTTTNEKEERYLKDFDSALRSRWLDEYKGIKVFRDGFRVRPYGEADGSSYDWLGLGARKSISPAGIGKSDGGWRVPDHNISGVVSISRIENPDFVDKSSREGIQENRAFEVFKQILIGIIAYFEKDRSHITRELIALHKELNPLEQNAVEATAIANRVLSVTRKSGNKNKTEEEVDLEILAKHAEWQQEKIEELIDEQRILRIMASNGTMLATFVHELQGIKDHLFSRAKTLKKLTTAVIDKKALEKVLEHQNPLIFLEDMEKYDQKLVHWMQFALGAVRKDKRHRKIINLSQYFDGLEKNWIYHLQERKTTLTINKPLEKVHFKAFETDLDTIFNNLIINSVEAFQRLGKPNKRNIRIGYFSDGNSISITYKDTGPGLHKSIKDPNKIFDIFYTTKRDPNTAELVGSGLGMWLVKSTLKDYKGNISFLKQDEGFGIKIVLPSAKGRQSNG